MKKTEYSVVIVGSGIAGLFAALKISENQNIDKGILLVTKAKLGESNSRYAQGGIVAVLPENNQDSVSLHVSDTIKAGAGLSDINITKFISERSAEVINDLTKYGVSFDKDNSQNFSLTLEGAHSVKRILHAGGDATGKSMEVALSNAVMNNDKITILEETQAVELLINSEEKCKGVILFDAKTNEYTAVCSPAVVIASGGFGQVYSNTTNPSIATGDGIAMAYRANAVVQDIEFVQFHPTALSAESGESRFLISESVRGEGARLRNSKGELFTFKYNNMGDLAPRDVVTRSIYFEMQETNSNCVYLDATIIDKDRVMKRFPNISRVCKENGVDIYSEPIPVSPAAHYAMGGIKVNTQAQSSIEGLYAVGEAGCTSLHGANRLASNSLLECVVSSSELANNLANTELNLSNAEDNSIANTISLYEKDTLPLKENELNTGIKSLKETMWECAGIVRSQQSLGNALRIINDLKRNFGKLNKCSDLKEYEYRNMLTIAELIVQAALARRESRGAHYREDCTETSNHAYHSFMKKGELLSSNVLPVTPIFNRKTH